MVLEHAVAILLFSGPLFYIGLWMAIDPAGFASTPGFVLGIFRRLGQRLAGLPAEQIVQQTIISSRVKTALRVVGAALVVFAIIV